MKYLLIFALLLSACTSPSGVKAIVGAKLGSIDYSVVVIENGKIIAAGPQSQVQRLRNHPGNRHGHRA
jgi:hypothetical protein